MSLCQANAVEVGEMTLDAGAQGRFKRVAKD
jgi:hypothetical protein